MTPVPTNTTSPTRRWRVWPPSRLGRFLLILVAVLLVVTGVGVWRQATTPEPTSAQVTGTQYHYQWQQSATGGSSLQLVGQTILVSRTLTNAADVHALYDTTLSLPKGAVRTAACVIHYSVDEYDITFYQVQRPLLRTRAVLLGCDYGVYLSTDTTGYRTVTDDYLSALEHALGLSYARLVPA